MGNCIAGKRGKNNGNQMLQRFKTADDGLYYKPKINSSTLICYRPTDRAFWDVKIDTNLMFQAGALFGKIRVGKYICIGGVENGDVAFIIDTTEKKTIQINKPPMSLAYGRCHAFQNKVYVVGSLCIEADGLEKPAVPLVYDIRTNLWTELPKMPVNVSLCGSFIVGKGLNLIGGFLNYPSHPTLFRSMLQLDLNTLEWAQSSVTTPVLHGLPSCVVLTENAIMIIGGHDPCEHYSSDESKSTYIFNGREFQALSDLPSVGQLRFSDSPLYAKQEVLLYSDDETLFTYDLNSGSWSYFDIEEKMVGKDPPIQTFLEKGKFVYHFCQMECEIIEYNMDNKTSKKTGPASFHNFYKYTGLCILGDGRLMFAGGLKEDHSEGTVSCWTLDPQSRHSENIAELKYKQYGLRLVVIDRVVYAVAGVESSENLYPSPSRSHCQKYSLDLNQWVDIEPLSSTTFLPGACHMAGRIFCIGGYVEVIDSAVNLNLIQVYSIAQNHWDILTIEYPFGVSSLGVAPLPGNKLLCFGGQCQNGIKIPNTYIFDGYNFQYISDLPIPEEGADSTVFSDPTVIVGNKIYAFSENRYLYCFDFGSQSWHTEMPNISVRC
ncbi:unnamed protein product [Blepharisma stoltei]|uniref:Uncharacterized protein n=1 Tax=Blepharisma stoltei TaxID=1481888 RepID=A0AAU9J7K2_9CILI|nr:unnamed protein product [Blepharisma stoltei]